MSAKLNYHEQIKQAFSVKPDVAGIIHGQRQVLEGAPGRRVAIFPSHKSQGSFVLESSLEEATAICIESSMAALRMVTQGLRVDLSANTHVLIDFVVERTDGSFVAIEVKPSLKGLSDSKKERYRQCGELLAREGIEFRIVDRNHLPNKFEVYQLLTLYNRGHQREWSSEIINIALKTILNSNAETLGQARKALQVEDIPAELCEYLVFHKLIAFSDWANTTLEIAA